MAHPTFTILAHRALLAGPDPATENTLPAIEAALGSRFPIEFDVTVDADGARLVLSHDIAAWSPEREPRDLFAMPAATGPHALNVKDLCALPAILDLLEQYDARERFFLFDFELVSGTHRGARYLMRSVQERGLAVAHRVSEREPYARVYAADPSVNRIWLDEFERHALCEADVRRLVEAGKRCIYISPDLHRHEAAEALRARWLEVVSWGVHGICTDYPVALRTVLEGAFAS